MLERDRVPRGSTALSSGSIPAAGTRFQRAKGIADSPALFTADLMAKNKGRSSRQVTARVAERAGLTLRLQSFYCPTLEELTKRVLNEIHRRNAAAKELLQR